MCNYVTVKRAIIVALVALVLLACNLGGEVISDAATPTALVQPTDTPPSSTARPTNTAVVMASPEPSATPVPLPESSTAELTDDTNAVQSNEHEAKIQIARVDELNSLIERRIYFLDDNILSFEIDDDLFDGYECASGIPLFSVSSPSESESALHGAVDIVAVTLAHVVESDIGVDTESAGPWVQLRVLTARPVLSEAIAGFQTYGGDFKVTDSNRGIAANPEWYPDGLGNVSFTWFVDPATMQTATFTGLVEPNEGGNSVWTPYAGVHNFGIDEDGNLVVEVPVEWFDWAEQPNVTLTDGENCDTLSFSDDSITLIRNGPAPPVQQPQPANSLWPSNPQVAPERFLPADNFVNGGTFANTSISPTKSNRIRLAFEANGLVPCDPKNLKIVTVMHVRNDETGEIVSKYTDFSNDYPEGTIPFHGLGFILDAGRSSNDIHVQTMPRIPIELIEKFNLGPGLPWQTGDGQSLLADENGIHETWVVNTDPSVLPTQSDGNTIIGIVEPKFIPDGYTAYYETAVICYKDDSFQVLGSMRWAFNNPQQIWMIPNANGNINWGAATNGLVESVTRFRTGEGSSDLQEKEE